MSSKAKFLIEIRNPGKMREREREGEREAEGYGKGEAEGHGKPFSKNTQPFLVPHC
jgi:hypothetical protein